MAPSIQPNLGLPLNTLVSILTFITHSFHVTKQNQNAHILSTCYFLYSLSTKYYFFPYSISSSHTCNTLQVSFFLDAFTFCFAVTLMTYISDPYVIVVKIFLSNSPLFFFIPVILFFIIFFMLPNSLHLLFSWFYMSDSISLLVAIISLRDLNISFCSSANVFSCKFPHFTLFYISSVHKIWSTRSPTTQLHL